MDEVRARQALQRVAYAEDWLGRLKDDLAAGHNRSAMTHLLTAQAELKLLSEQLAPALGWAEEVEQAPLAIPAAMTGYPRRPPLAWAAVGLTALALVLFSGQLLPDRSSPTLPAASPVTETGTPVLTVLAQEPAQEEPTVEHPVPAAVAAVPAPVMAGDEASAASVAVPDAEQRSAMPEPVRRPRMAAATTGSPVEQPLPASTVPVAEPVIQPDPTSRPIAQEPPRSPADLILQAMRAARHSLERN